MILWEIWDAELPSAAAAVWTITDVDYDSVSESMLVGSM